MQKHRKNMEMMIAQVNSVLNEPIETEEVEVLLKTRIERKNLKKINKTLTIYVLEN